MGAAVLFGTGDLRLVDDVSIPSLEAGHVLVRMEYSAICGRQLAEIDGYYGEDKYLPHMLGHEGVGVVLSIGRGVTKVGVGDYVVLTWMKADGLEVPSNQYHSREYGMINGGAVTTWSDYAMTCENRVVKIDPMGPVGALLGCAIPTGAGIILNQTRPRPGSYLAVVGCGGVGGAAIMMGAYMQYNVIAIDRYQGGAYPIDLGASKYIQTSDALAEEIREYTGGAMCSYVVETSGSYGGMQAAYDITSNDGLCIIAGNAPKGGGHIDVDPYDLIHGRRIIGSWGGSTKPEVDIPMYSKLPVGWDKLLGNIYQLKYLDHAVHNARNSGVRTLLRMIP